MKELASTIPTPGSAQPLDIARQSDDLVVLGKIAGLARLLPGRYQPGQPVRSRYGTWILPVAFKGRRVTAIVNGTLLG